MAVSFKSLVVIPSRCTACHRCELACSFYHEKELAISKARLEVVKFGPDESLVAKPIICPQCGICIDSCPVNAIRRNNRTGAVIIVNDKCTGCGLCVPACPYGMIKMSVFLGGEKAYKCDYCDGDPECVKHCPYDALKFVDIEKATMYKGLYITSNMEGEKHE